MTAIAMLDASEITQSVEGLLDDAQTLGGEGVTIERSAAEPTDCPENGWIGIYRVGMQFPERALGASYAGRSHRIDLMLMLLQTGKAGDECEDRLGKLVKDTLDVLLTDGSFGGKVNFLDNIEVRYPDYQRNENASEYRQTAFIFITGLKSI